MSYGDELRLPMPRAVQHDSDCSQCASFCRPVLAAAHSPARLAAAAAAVLDQPGYAPAWLTGQIGASCAVLASCTALACSAPQLSAQAAYRLGAACSLVLGPGRTVLEASTPAVQLPPSAAQTQQCATICWVQVPPLTAILDGFLRPERQPQAAAALAITAAKPSALLPWLAALCRTLSLVGTKAGGGEWTQHLPV